MDKIGIVLINFTGYAERFLDECRDSLRGQIIADAEYSIIIVDNCGNDASKKYLREKFPEAIYIQRPDGNYCAANNVGIVKSMALGCDFVVIANMDTRFAPDWLSALVLAVKSDENIGAAQSKILLYPRNPAEEEAPRINSLGNAIHYLGFGYTCGYGEPDINDNSQIVDLDGYASGCSVILRIKALKTIGLYNEDFYMYHDDLELGWRLRLSGYRIVLASRSVVYHKYEFTRSSRMIYYMERNRLLSLLLFYKIRTILVLLPMIVAMEVGMFFFSLVNGWFSQKLKCWRYFLSPRNAMKIFRTRRSVQAGRKVSDQAIFATMRGRILFQEIANPILDYVANPILNLYYKSVKKIILW